MDKIGHINYWKKSSDEDWETMSALFNSGRFVHSLFFAHLSLEKLCKALWVMDNEEYFPPKIHSLVKLLSATKINVNDDDLKFLQEFNDFQLEGRYPDYLFEINKLCNKDYTSNILVRVKSIRKCLQEKLP